MYVIYGNVCHVYIYSGSFYSNLLVSAIHINLSSQRVKPGLNFAVNFDILVLRSEKTGITMCQIPYLGEERCDFKMGTFSYWRRCDVTYKGLKVLPQRKPSKEGHPAYFSVVTKFKAQKVLWSEFFLTLDLKWWRKLSQNVTSKSFLCRLRSIAAHRDHFVQRLSVCLSSSHTVLVVSHSYDSQATHAFLGMLPL